MSPFPGFPQLCTTHTPIHGLLMTVWLIQSKGRISLPEENENKALMDPSWEEDDQESGMGQQQTYPDSTPSTRFSIKKEPMMMRGMKYNQFQVFPEASLLCGR